MKADNKYIRSRSVFQVRHLGEDGYWVQKIDVMCFNLCQIIDVMCFNLSQINPTWSLQGFTQL